jgi:hypothetical protein
MFERLVHAGEVGFSKAPLPGGWLCREQHATQIAFIQVGRNGPVEPGLPRSIQVLDHGAVADVECLGYTPVA